MIEIWVIAIFAAVMLGFGILNDHEARQRYIREQQERRDQQILEWDYQLRLNPWLKDIYEGRITQADVDAARMRQKPEEKRPVDWEVEGF